MASNTSKLNLYKADPVVDSSNTFNIDTMLNENWDKIDTHASDVDGKTGDLQNLTTTHKSSLVGAINEVNAEADTNASKIGTLTNLTTTDKSNLVGALNEVKSGAETPSGAQAKVDAHATLTNNPHAVTASQVGAVAKAGDTMSGQLTISNIAPQLILDESDSTDVDGKKWIVGVDGNSFWIGEDSTDSTKRRLTIGKGGTLYAGTSNIIYHSGNLPANPWEIISSTDVNGLSTINFNSLSNHKLVRIIFSLYTSSTNNLYLRFDGNTSTNYSYLSTYFDANNNVANVGSNSSDSIAIPSLMANNGQALTGEIDIYSPGSGSYIYCSGRASRYAVNCIFGGALAVTSIAPLDSVQLFPGSGTFTGHISVLGVRR